MLKRIGLFACAVLALIPLGSVRADQPFAGRVLLPTLTPNATRLAHTMTMMPNGTVGYVMHFHHNIAGRRYTLTKTDGLTGFEDPDVFFYHSLDGFGNPCKIDGGATTTGDVESGVACPGADHPAEWAIVVLKSGANATFTLSV